MRDPEFFGSALALSDPVAIDGNKIELLNNGDAFFPAMLKAIRSAQQTVNFAAYISTPMKSAISFATLFASAPGLESRSASFSMALARGGVSIIPTSA